MNHFNVISSIILIGLAILCFWLPYRNGKKLTGTVTGLLLGLIIVWTILAELEFLVIFIWPVILVFQIIFLSYWIFKVFNLKKIGIIVSSALSLIFLLLAMSPWIEDWTFNENDAKRILEEHHISLKDDFELTKNESGGFRDYMHKFELEISDRDKSNLIDKIKSSENFIEYDSTNQQYPYAERGVFEVMNYETRYDFNIEYYLENPMEDGTVHFHFMISKEKNKMEYVGIDE